MLHYDIINPLVSKFLAKISGQGGGYYSADAVSKVNDFADYLCSIQDDLEFAYFPLRKHNNIGYGNEAFGIGNLSSGASLKFPNQAIWHESGIFLNSRQNCAEIEFSGVTSDPNFQFRKNPTTVFYFLKHARGKYETELYRPSVDQPPYFCFDKSVDTYTVVAPCFSIDQFRPTGTTYIYDEIFGGDKKGFTIDFSADQVKKIVQRNPGSFYEADNGTENFVCLMLYSQLDSYEIRSFYGKDPGIYTGTFPDPYRITVVPGTVEDPQYWMPTRMVIGAGMSNLGRQTYDTDGLDHYCGGFLIFKGDQRNNASDIAENMAQSLAIKIPPLPVNSPTLNDNIFTRSNVTGLLYTIGGSKLTNAVDTISNIISPNIIGFFLRDIGNWSIGRVGNRWDAFSPVEYFEWGRQNQITGADYITGLINYKLLPIENIYNQGIYGKISGTMFPDGTFEPFAPNLVSSFSGFYSGVYTNYSGLISGSGLFGPYSIGYTGQRLTLLEQNVIGFPPYRTSGTEKIFGYISGRITDNFNFLKFNDNLASSGYFINQKRVDFPYSGFNNEYITGYISGTLNENGNFLPATGIYQNSGFIKNDLFYKFLPDQILEPELITGFLFGTMLGDGTFVGKDQDPIITGEYSGYYYNNFQDIYFSTGANASVNFEKTPGFVDPELGYEFSGFFVEQSGFIGFVDPFIGEGIMTGFIGYRNILKYSGEFTGISGLNELNYGYGNLYSGYSTNSFTGFSGAEIDQFTDEYLTTGRGILTGFIGTVSKLIRIDFQGFDNEPDFDPGFPNKVYGFNFSSSGFVSDSTPPRARMIGFISGYVDESLQFTNYASVGDGLSGSSGYFVDNKQYFFNQNQVNHLDFYSKNSNFKYPSLIYSGYSFTEGSGFSGTVSNFFGNGIITGYIGHINISSGDGILTGYLGERDLLIQSGKYEGLSGFGFTNPYLKAVGTTFTFYDSTGFYGIYNETTGIGFLSGLITTGLGSIPISDIIYPIGNFSFGTGTGFASGLIYSPGVIPVNISGTFTGQEFLSGMMSGNITGFEYVSSTREISITGISGDFMTGRSISGNITGLVYITGIIEYTNITGINGDIMMTGFSANVDDILFVSSEITSNINETNSGIMSGNIFNMEYFEYFTGTILPIESGGSISGNINDMFYQSDALTHISGIDTGVYSVSGFGRVGAYIYPSVLETGNYLSSGLEITSIKWIPPTSGLIFRFDADTGITTGFSGQIINWQDSYSGITALSIINTGQIYKSGSSWIVDKDWIDREVTHFIAISGGIYSIGSSTTTSSTYWPPSPNISVRYRFAVDTNAVFLFREAFSSFFNSWSHTNPGGKAFADPIDGATIAFSDSTNPRFRSVLDRQLIASAPIENYPLIKTGEYYNRRSVSFDGNSYFKVSIPTGFINNQDRSYVIIGKYNDPTGRNSETMLSSDNIFGNIEHAGFSNKNRYWNQLSGTTPTLEIENSAISSYFIQTIIHKDNQQIMRINDSSISITGNNTVSKRPQTTFYIGGASGSIFSASGVMSGSIAEILVYNRALTELEMEQIEAYADI